MTSPPHHLVTSPPHHLVTTLPPRPHPTTSSPHHPRLKVAAHHDDASPSIKTYLTDGESIAWKCNLTFVDISTNVNKFYTIEALENGKR